MSNPLQPMQQPKVDSDLTKKILRGINDTVRQLEDVRGRASAVAQLFSTSARVLRSKLHDLCYRFIFTDPSVNSKRGEEILWKKAYYDVFITAKRLKKEGESWSEEESSLVRGMLLTGIGFYQHLIFRLHADYALHIEGVADFSMVVSDDGLDKGKASAGKSEEAAWADEMASHCLLYMGDLTRYLRDLEPGWNLAVAERYYTQAAWLDASNGRPHNQLGTLAGGKNFSLDAVYHYMRSIHCASTFHGAENNLTKVLEKNWSALELEPLATAPTSLAQRIIMRFLFLVDVWFCGKNVDNIQLYCSEVVVGFEQLIKEPEQESEKAKEITTLFTNKEPSQHLPASAVITMFSIIFMCWEKLKQNESLEKKAVVATLLMMMESIIKQLNEKCEISAANRKKIRARRRRKRCNSDDSSGSEVQSATDSDLNSDSPDVSSGEDDSTNGTIISSKFAWIASDLMAALSIVCCWLSNNKEVAAGCPASMKQITEKLAVILNKLHKFVRVGNRIRLQDSKFPLPEEAQIRGTPGLADHFASLDWSLGHRQLSKHEQVILRAHRIIKICQQLPELRFDKISNLFYPMEEVKVETPTIDSSEKEFKGKLMKNMGQLWLKAEVKDLENRTKRVNGIEYSPYIVVDVDALIEHIALIKQIVGSRQFIVVIPTVVLSQLDECKKISGKARETIRWLESQFLRGNRHLRSQKAQERSSLGVIKYPKKKDKEAWNFFQVMECCSYLSKQSELRNKGGGNVTFLTGSKDAAQDFKQTNSQDFSPSGLASTLGVTLEYAETFHSKWKLCYKSNG